MDWTALNVGGRYVHRAIAYAVAKPDMTAGAGGVDGAPRPWRRCYSTPP